MINYKAIKRQNPQNKGEYKWYPSIVLTNPMLLDELAEAIALNCTVTAHDIKAVLSAMQEQIIFALRQGRSVRLGDLGSFRLTISGKGEADAASVTEKSIQMLRVRYCKSTGMEAAFQLKSKGIGFHKVGDVAEPGTSVPGGSESGEGEDGGL